jgi:hypothetical protein
MVLVTTIVLANHGTFTAHSLLRTQAYDMALRFREVQQLAVSVGATVGGYNRQYGIRWEASDYNRYSTFSIPAFTGALDPGAVTPIGAPSVLDERFEIVCVQINTGPGFDAAGCEPSTEAVYVVFKRPNFDAKFYAASGAEYVGARGVRLTLGPRGTAFNGPSGGSLRRDEDERSITITRTGQISVDSWVSS